ncbi:MAG: hypothetical protein V7L21_22210 [Nostoc sp.]|uniref:hypothetical protein n=1 Tax=Nostoc sp. TaxID=1180 RepID=UPI002FF66C46
MLVKILFKHPVNRMLNLRPLAKILESPLPNPPLVKGRGQNFKFPPNISGGLRGVYSTYARGLLYLDLLHKQAVREATVAGKLNQVPVLKTMEISSSCAVFTENHNFSYLFKEFAVQATVSDFSEICELFKVAVEYYRNKGIKQWEKGYDLGKIYQNIIKGETFVTRNESGVLLCTFAISKLLPDYYPEYLKSDSNILSIKSLCTDVKIRIFIGREVFSRIIQTAINNHISKIYLDFVVDNPTLEYYYKRYGFKSIAIVKHPTYHQNMAIMVLNNLG